MILSMTWPFVNTINFTFILLYIYISWSFIFTYKEPVIKFDFSISQKSALFIPRFSFFQICCLV